MDDTGITITISVPGGQAQVSMDSDVWARMQGNANAVYLLLARLEHFARIRGDASYRLDTPPEEVIG